MERSALFASFPSPESGCPGVRLAHPTTNRERLDCGGCLLHRLLMLYRPVWHDGIAQIRPSQVGSSEIGTAQIGLHQNRPA